MSRARTVPHWLWSTHVLWEDTTPATGLSPLVQDRASSFQLRPLLCAASFYVTRAGAPLRSMSVGRRRSTRAYRTRAACRAGCGCSVHDRTPLHRREVSLLWCETVVRRDGCGLQRAAGLCLARSLSLGRMRSTCACRACAACRAGSDRSMHHGRALRRRKAFLLRSKTMLRHDGCSIQRTLGCCVARGGVPLRWLSIARGSVAGALAAHEQYWLFQFASSWQICEASTEYGVSIRAIMTRERHSNPSAPLLRHRSFGIHSICFFLVKWLLRFRPMKLCHVSERKWTAPATRSAPQVHQGQARRARKKRRTCAERVGAVTASSAASRGAAASSLP